MNTQQCCITAALCYTLCCTKNTWLTCTCPGLVHHHSLQSSTTGYADFVRQTSQIMILVCAWFLLCLQKEPYCDSPGWISEYSELKTMTWEWTTRFFCFLQMDRHTDHFIDFCLWGHSLTYDFFMDLSFFFWTSLNFYEKNNCVALCCNTVLKIQSIYTNWGQKFRNYGKIVTKCHMDQLPTYFGDIIPLTSENTALS